VAEPALRKPWTESLPWRCANELKQLLAKLEGKAVLGARCCVGYGPWNFWSRRNFRGAAVLKRCPAERRRPASHRKRRLPWSD